MKRIVLRERTPSEINEATEAFKRDHPRARFGLVIERDYRAKTGMLKRIIFYEEPEI